MISYLFKASPLWVLPLVTANIAAGQEGNFVKLTDSQNKSAYDFLSIMEYSRNSLSVDAASDTIEPLPAYAQYLNLMGQQFDPVLSASDRAGMASIYGAGPALTFRRHRFGFAIKAQSALIKP